MREGLEVDQEEEKHLPAPAPREMVELENSLATVVSQHIFLFHVLSSVSVSYSFDTDPDGSGPSILG